jgi:hypothetical protein
MQSSSTPPAHWLAKIGRGGKLRERERQAGERCWWLNLESEKKSNYLVSFSDFDSFKVKSRKELNLKIRRSKVFW